MQTAEKVRKCENLMDMFERAKARETRLKTLERYDALGSGMTVGSIRMCCHCKGPGTEVPLPWLTGFERPTHVWLHGACRDAFFSELTGVEEVTGTWRD